MRYYIIMSRILFIFLIMTAILTGANARTPQVVKLDAPDLSRGTSLMEALKEKNIMLFCAANGLVTVPRASMDSAAIATLLKLPEGALPIINNPVGYPAK